VSERDAEVVSKRADALQLLHRSMSIIRSKCCVERCACCTPRSCRMVAWLMMQQLCALPVSHTTVYTALMGLGQMTAQFGSRLLAGLLALGDDVRMQRFIAGFDRWIQPYATTAGW
jgi:hypothetical protein